MKIWQIATGEPGRDYRELFFSYDIMILGPGHLGSAMGNHYTDGIPNSERSQVHNFAYRPKPGDRIIMRFAHDVIGVGQLPLHEQNQYSFEADFRCVYGWDLRHCRRVIWADPSTLELGELATVFQRAKQKPSFTQIHEKHIVDRVRSIGNEYFDRPLKELPKKDTSVYTDESLGVALFRAGISNKNINDILQALQQAERLCSWYRSELCGRKPSENEIVSHIILPLFLGLGWSHQQIAIEWNRVDVAFFKTTPTIKESCVIALEAKGLGNALTEVLEQPLRYIVHLDLSNVVYVVVTDGENLFVYGKKEDHWDSNPIGYLSTRYLQKEYMLPNGLDLVDTLVKLQPNMV
ncbi:MAG: hypothetical protein H6658_04505 [Ardenticatenaceae bacterium]|nr:hypothetical protein [Ardenticatenaceae bacterium]